jgi:uncharacterized membrane protein
MCDERLKIMAKKVLFAGESWMATVTEVKGFNAFSASKYETGLGWIDKAIEKAGYELVYMPSHIAADHFPYTMEELKEYACVVLSDIGADTLLIPTETFSTGKRFPNRCQLLKDYVLQGGGLLMIGGYMTFTGIGGQGKWWATPVQDVLPVQLLTCDDRMEHCEGVSAESVDAGHPVLNGIQGEWPPVLGYNKSILKEGAELVATLCGDPFIAFGNYGEGRTGVFSSDCSPHWAPKEFCDWEGYDRLFKNIIDYIVR